MNAYVARVLAPLTLGFFVGCHSGPPAAEPARGQAGGGATSATPPASAVALHPTAARAQAPTDPARIRQFVTSAERSALERREPRPFIAMLATDLVAVASRSSIPSPFDSQFGRDRVAVIYRAATRQTARSESVSFMNPVTTVAHNNEAHLEHDVVFTASNGNRTTALHEVIDLALRDGRWVMVRFQYWPLLPDSLEEYPQSFWDEQDATVTAMTQSGDDRQLAYALMSGYRFDECAVVTRRLTAADPNDAWGWEMRATASMMVGDEDDSDRAAVTAKRLKQAALGTNP
ncbi:MAG: hypothetical protein U0271_10215 [Polyangiaceae bacterium]